MLVAVNDIGKKPASFEDAAVLASTIIDSGFEYDFGQLYYNFFK